MSDPTDAAPPRLSRRGLFGRGLARLTEEAPSALAASPLGDALLQAAPAASSESAPGQHRTPRATTSDAGDATVEPAATAFDVLLEPAAEHILRLCGLSPGDSLLNVGAGNGHLAMTAARRGAEVTAVDLSSARVRANAEASEREGLEVTWLATRSRSLFFEQDSFDCVASSLANIVALRGTRLLTEMARVARPGGVIALALWESSGSMGRLLDFATASVPRAQTAKRLPLWDRGEAQLEHLRAILDDVSVSSDELRLTLPSVDSVWQVFCSESGPLAGIADTLDAVSAEEMRGTFTDVAGLELGLTDGPSVVLDTRYLTLTGRKPD